MLDNPGTSSGNPGKSLNNQGFWKKHQDFLKLSNPGQKIKPSQRTNLPVEREDPEFQGDRGGLGFKEVWGRSVEVGINVEHFGGSCTCTSPSVAKAQKAAMGIHGLTGAPLRCACHSVTGSLCVYRIPRGCAPQV